MYDWSAILEGLALAATPMNLAFMALGVTIGMIAGAAPGLCSAPAIAVLLPITFGMDPDTALILLAAVFVGAMQGGSITAILANIPGTGAASATAVDGNKLAQKGRAGDALAAATLSSVIGSFFGMIALLFFAPVLAEFSLQFGSAEYVAITIFGLTIIGTLLEKSPIKGLMAGAMGLMLGTIGFVPFGAVSRFTFGSFYLYDGINLIWGIIGLFAVTQALTICMEKGATVEKTKLERFNLAMLKRVGKVFSKMKLILPLNAIIGLIIGVVPGAGGSTACWVSYGETKRRMYGKTEFKFGEGATEGVVAAEVANNAVVGGSLIPTLTLGIPGSGSAAVLLGAFMLTGLRPGHELFTEFAVESYAIILSLFFATAFFAVLGLATIPISSKFVTLPNEIIAPTIIALGTVGTFISGLHVVGVYVAFIIGALAYILKQMDFPMPPILLGLILSRLLENNIHRLTIVSRDVGIIQFFLNRPISLVLIALSLLIIISTVKRHISNKTNESVPSEKGGLDA